MMWSVSLQTPPSASCAPPGATRAAFPSTSAWPSWLASCFLSVANPNAGSVANGMAMARGASTIRDYFRCEALFFDGGWMDDRSLREGPGRRAASSKCRTTPDWASNPIRRSCKPSLRHANPGGAGPPAGPRAGRVVFASVAAPQRKRVRMLYHLEIKEKAS